MRWFQVLEGSKWNNKEYLERHRAPALYLALRGPRAIILCSIGFLKQANSELALRSNHTRSRLAFVCFMFPLVCLELYSVKLPYTSYLLGIYITNLCLYFLNPQCRKLRLSFSNKSY